MLLGTRMCEPVLSVCSHDWRRALGFTFAPPRTLPPSRTFYPRRTYPPPPSLRVDSWLPYAIVPPALTCLAFIVPILLWLCCRCGCKRKISLLRCTSLYYGILSWIYLAFGCGCLAANCGEHHKVSGSGSAWVEYRRELLLKWMSELWVPVQRGMLVPLPWEPSAPCATAPSDDVIQALMAFLT